jgi:hypothetical protein
LEWNQQKIGPTPEPNYKYVGGYFDKAVTPLAATELAKRFLEDLKGKEKEYFRDKYGVGSETIGKDIPSNILKSLGARSAIILSYIIESSKTGKRLLGLQILKPILNIYYFLVQRSSPSSYKTQASPLISALKSLLLFIIAFGVIAYLLNILPRWAVLIIATLALLWIIKSLLGVLFGRTSK